MKLAEFTLTSLAVLLLFGMASTPSAAQNVDTEWKWSSVSDAMTDPWRFSVIGYGWAPSAPVSVKTNEGTTNLPEDFDTILDDLDFAAMSEMEVHKGPFGVFFSPIYYDGTDRESFTGLAGNKRSVKIEESVWLIDYGVSYDLGALRLGEHSDSPTVTLQPYAGGRYLHDNFKMKLDAGPIEPGIDIHETLEFNTPIIGISTNFDLTDSWELRLEGDYGGFNVDDVNETYQIFGGLGYKFKMGDTIAKVFAGYRYLHVDYEKEVELEVTIKGPLIGFGFEF